MEEEEEVNPGGEDVHTLITQESAKLVCILSSQKPAVIKKLCDMMPNKTLRHVDWLALTESSAMIQQHVTVMLEDYRTASAARCRRFLQSLCMLCENIPLHLELRLLSSAGCMDSDRYQSQVTELFPLKVTDHWELYRAAVGTLLLRRWERMRENLVREVQLEDIWVRLRHTNRTKEKPDQTPGPGDLGNRTPDPDGDYGPMEARVTLESFLQGSVGQVTVLLGQAGSGKTLMMSCLGQQWAKGLGPIPSSFLFVLLEFRQLNLLSSPLSLSELLFQYYLPAQGGDDEKEAVLDYLLSNPEQCCWVLDGYDEFHTRITRVQTQRNRTPLNSNTLLPIAEFVSGLLCRQIFPGCTLVFTCRPRDIPDVELMVDNVAELAGWESHDIKEYVQNYFQLKGAPTNEDLMEQAVNLLFSSRHLLTMSSLPGLCNICCVCVDHALMGERGGGRTQASEGEEQKRRRRESEQGGRKEAKVEGEEQAEQSGEGAEGIGEGSQDRGAAGGGESEDITRAGAVEPRDGVEVLHRASFSLPQLPPTLTQLYLTALVASLSHSRDTGTERGEDAKNDRMKTRAPQQSTLCSLDMGLYQSEVCELSRLAWKGLETSQILFLKCEIPQNVLKFSIRAGLLSKVELRLKGGVLSYAYCFVHLTLQEFLAALRMMTSDEVPMTQLKQRFNLKSRWTTKSDPKTVFTDSFHLYVCGLASPSCTPALVQLAKSCGVSVAQAWVQKRQSLVVKLLKSLCGSTLTGPKVLQLCHCIQETQDCQLARDVLGTRPILELRNIRLLPSDIDALAFVVGSSPDMDVGLDFGGCALDAQCLDVLPSCQCIHYLVFRSRKYDDKFAQKLSSILPKLQTLRKLEFSGGHLTDVGVASLASTLQDCPCITEINLHSNNLTNQGIKHVADIFSKLPNLASITLGRHNKPLEGITVLIKKMTTCVNIVHVHAEGMKELKVTFLQNSDNKGHKNISGPTVSLVNQTWGKTEMQRLCQLLARCPALSVLDLSGGHLDTETLRMLVDFLPRINIKQRIIMKESCISSNGLEVLTALLSTCPTAVELNVRLKSPECVSVMFSGGTDGPRPEISRKLCLSCCNLLPAVMGNVLGSLGPSSDITLLDLSSNKLGDSGLKKLLDFLPCLNNIKEINASKNNMSMKGAVMLASALGSRPDLTDIEISYKGRGLVILRFCSNKSSDEEKLKRFRLAHTSIQPLDMTRLCRRLAQCHSPMELDLSHSSMIDGVIQKLLTVLPTMTSLQLLNVSHCNLSIRGMLTLVSCLIDGHRVKSVELRPQGESMICFDRVKAEFTRCRLSHFSLNSGHLEKLAGILEQCAQLSELDLSGNSLKDEGVRQVVNALPRLKITSCLNLSSNSLTQQGALDVASTLCACDKVSGVEVSLGAEDRSLIHFNQGESCGKSLSVRHCKFESDELIRLSEILCGCPSLTKLEFTSICPCYEGLQTLWNSLCLLPSLHMLEFRDNLFCSQWVEDLVKGLKGSDGGRHVSIEEFWITSEAAVSLVCRCLNLNPHIHTIRVQQTTLHLYFMKTTPLTSVSLVDCLIEGNQLKTLSSIIQRCPLLTDLDLSHNKWGTEGAQVLCSVLPSLPNLTSLSLSGNFISDRGAEILATVFCKLPRLRSVNLSHCGGWTVTGGLELIRSLEHCVSLEELSLDSVPLDEDTKVCLARGLSKTNSLRKLNLNRGATVAMVGSQETKDTLELLSVMEQRRQIEEIELEGWAMADRGVGQLIKLLPVWKHLRKIRLSKNFIGDRSGEALMEAFRSCNHLEELYLSSNGLGRLTAARMALVLPSLIHMTVLDISDNSLGYEGSVSLSRALVYMKNLIKLNLTSIGTSDLCAVAASLAHCMQIQDVSLGWNHCDDNLAVELAKVLPLCQKLIRLDLESNSISVYGAEVLVRALQSCPALQFIRLWRNKISRSEVQNLTLKDKRLNFLST
ncbi:NLR family, CARD domain containing 5 [Lampris incognitus]|uniref:NLR family, CARD domain containing 5 n=1 Tax=Lampris incognitus TaxID=2546036 RepID=UPI0024B5DE42|nr:NLR family, CARD domain containing 5 [Lampris incognitus]